MATKSKLIDLDNQIDHFYTDNLTSQSQLFENDGAYFYGVNEVRPTTDQTNYKNDNRMDFDATDSGSEIELIEVTEEWVDTQCECYNHDDFTESASDDSSFSIKLEKIGTSK